MRSLSRLLVVLFCFAFPGFIQQDLFAQQDTSPAPVTLPAQNTAHAPGPDRRISLDIVVTDKSGKPVSGLHQPDFTVLDDKQPQTILSFHAADGAAKTPDPPMQAILLVDAVNASFQGVGYQRQQIQNFLQQDGGQLSMPTSVAVLTDKTAQIQPTPTRDGKVLVDFLNSNESGLRTIGRSQGFYGGVERIQISLRALEALASYEATQPGRKLLIWVSSGWPLLSGPNVQTSRKDQEMLFNTVVALSTHLREARVTLYSIDAQGVNDASGPQRYYYRNFLKGVGSPSKTQNGNLGLQVLAFQSGGLVLAASNDIAGSIASCVADATAFYTLSFDSAPADNPNEYHALQVKIGKPGLTARTRTGYYAQR